MGWANTDTDPLVFPPGSTTGHQVLTIGSRVPDALVNQGIDAAIMFYSADGSYMAIAADNVGDVAVFHGLSNADPNPLVLMVWSGFNNTTLFVQNIGVSFGSFILPSIFKNNGFVFGARFVDFATINPLFVPVGYRMDADGWVHLEGLAFNNSGAAAVAGDIVMSGLPNPTSGKLEPLPTLTGGPLTALLQISPTGVLTILGLSVGGLPNGQNVVLNGIHYYAGYPTS